ncbi:MAG: hypothetical protein QXE14_01040 [Candidatus Bathyarchaeia archaeon]
MRRSVLLVILGLAVLGAVIFSLYNALASLACVGFDNGFTQKNGLKISPCIVDSRNFTCIPKRGWEWSMRDKFFRGFQVELSEGFKNRVLEIIKSDEDVQRLLNEGYNVSSIKIAQVKLVVRESGEIAIEAIKAIVVLTNGNGGRACVEVDLKAGSVTRIVVMNVKVIEKGSST